MTLNKTPNFKAMDWNEYRGYRYEADENGAVCIFNRFMRYLTTQSTVQQADAFVDWYEAKKAERATHRQPCACQTCTVLEELDGRDA